MKKVYILLAFVTAVTFAFAKTAETNGCTDKSAVKKTYVEQPILSGTVLDAETKKPLNDVTITIKTPGKADQSITTDAQGNFKMPTLAQGSYTIKFEKDDYRTGEKTNVAVKANPLKLSFELWRHEEESRQNVWDKHNFFR